MKAGINLYSVHKLIKTEEGLLDTAQKLKEMGYISMQYSGAEFIPERLKRVSDATGLPFVLTHMPADRIVNDTDKLMEEHAVFGCTNIGLGSIPIVAMVTEENIVDEKICKTKLEELNKAGEHMKKNGYSFFLHNHHYEFMRMSNGERIFDHIVENAPHINFTLDTYWVQYGGFDPAEEIRRLSGRIPCVHFKDMEILTDGEKRYCPVGAGILDFDGILSALEGTGCRVAFIEQDECFGADPFDCLKQSLAYLKSLGLN